LQHPGPNIYNASNVAVAASNGQLVLRVSKSGRGRSSSSSCAEVSLDQSLGLGTYIVKIDTNPTLVSAARGYCQASLLQLLPLLLLLCTLCTRQFNPHAAVWHLPAVWYTPAVSAASSYVVEIDTNTSLVSAAVVVVWSQLLPPRSCCYAQKAGSPCFCLAC
jgi:hypothetical protein